MAPWLHIVLFILRRKSSPTEGLGYLFTGNTGWAFNIGINIDRLLIPLRQTLLDSFEHEFVILHRSSGKTIELLQTSVIKRYFEAGPVEKLKTLYHEMENANVPFIDHLDYTNTTETKTPFASFSPKGVRHRPTSKEQLVKAIHCVLTALKVRFDFSVLL